jgi:DNA-directed RNA polymerase specialized sigma subunit
VPIDAPVARHDDDSAALVEFPGDEDAAYELVEEREAIASSWKTLPDLERNVLELRFLHDLTQRENRRADWLLANARLAAGAPGAKGT